MLDLATFAPPFGILKLKLGELIKETSLFLE